MYDHSFTNFLSIVYNKQCYFKSEKHVHRNRYAIAQASKTAISPLGKNSCQKKLLKQTLEKWDNESIRKMAKSMKETEAITTTAQPATKPIEEIPPLATPEKRTHPICNFESKLRQPDFFNETEKTKTPSRVDSNRRANQIPKTGETTKPTTKKPTDIENTDINNNYDDENQPRCNDFLLMSRCQFKRFCKRHE